MERTWPTITLTDRLPVVSRTSVAVAAARSGGLAHPVDALRVLEEGGERAHGLGEVADRLGDLRRNVLVEPDRPDRAARQHADVADREVDPDRRGRVVLDPAAEPPPRRRVQRGLPPGRNGVGEVLDLLIDPARAHEGRVGELALAGDDRRGDVVERRRQLVENGASGATDRRHGVGRQDEGVHEQRDRAARQRVEEARERDALGRRLDRRHQRGRHRRLVGHQLAAAEEDRQRDRQHDDQGELGRPDADLEDQQVPTAIPTATPIGISAARGRAERSSGRA